MDITAHKATATEPFRASVAQGLVPLTPPPRADGVHVAIGEATANTSWPEVGAAPQASAGARRYVGALIRLANWAVNGVVATWRTRRDLRPLLALDDHLLNDIGLMRADVEVLRYGWHRQP